MDALLSLGGLAAWRHKRPWVLVLALGCSAGGSSSLGTTHDAGQDASADDASDDACVFPLCSGSSSGQSGVDAAGDADSCALSKPR